MYGCIYRSEFGSSFKRVLPGRFNYTSEQVTDIFIEVYMMLYILDSATSTRKVVVEECWVSLRS